MSRNIVPFERKEEEHKKGILEKLGMEKKEDNDEEEEDEDMNIRRMTASKKRLQKMKLKKLAIQMHSLDFILTSLKGTKALIEEQYVNFIQDEFKQDAKDWLEREVIIKLRDCNICHFLFDNFVFVPLDYDEQNGCIISMVKKQAIEHKYMRFPSVLS